MNDWLAYHRSPEQRAIIRETTDRRYRYCVWYAISQIPSSLREQYYSTLPNYLTDKVRDRVKVIEKLQKRKRKC